MNPTRRQGALRAALLSLLGGLSIGLAQAEDAHYFVIKEQASGTLSVAAHQVVRLNKPLRAQTGLQASRHRRVLQGTLSDKADGKVVFDTQGSDAPFVRAEFHGTQGQIDGHLLASGEHTYVLRVPLGAGRKLRLQATGLSSGGATGAAPAPASSLVIDLDAYSTAGNSVAPAPVAGTDTGLLFNTGDAANRVDLVIVAEGYTLDQKAQFIQQATDLATRLLDIAPYSSYKHLVNVRWLFVPSNQAGADKPDCPETPGAPVVTVDTAFDAQYCASGLRRALVVNNTKVVTAAAATPGWDLLMVLVNDTEYGGTGGGVAVASTNSLAVDVMQHELGHTFSNLADEYDTPYPAFGRCSDLPGATLGGCEANVTDQTDRNALKWTRWLAGTTAVPTTAELADPIATGLWQGARYQSSGMYRQCFNGMMRALARPFCHVDSEAFVKRLLGGSFVRLIEPGFLPSTAAQTPPVGTAVGFKATVAGTASAGGITATWLVDGKVALTSATQHGAVQSFSYTPADTAVHSVALQVKDNSPYLLDAITTSTSWTVQGQATLPKPPVLNSVSGGLYSLSLKFTPPAAQAGVSIVDYIANCTAPNRSPVSARAKASPIGFSWLPGGVTYSCTVTSTSAQGNSVPSNAVSGKTLKLF